MSNLPAIRASDDLVGLVHKVISNEFASNLPAEHALARYLDTEAIEQWLNGLRNPSTQRSYRKEMGRFRAFLFASMANLTTSRVDAVFEVSEVFRILPMVDARVAESYEKWLRQPVFTRLAGDGSLAPDVQRGLVYEMAARRFGVGGKAVFPALSEKSVHHALVILSGFYEYAKDGIINTRTRDPIFKFNPFKAITNRSQKTFVGGMRAGEGAEKALTKEAWTGVLEWVEKLPFDFQNARDKFVIYLFNALWARRSEIAQIKWGDFFQSKGAWYVSIWRKGRGLGLAKVGETQDPRLKEHLPVPDWLMRAMKEYRLACGMTDTPLSSEADKSIFLKMHWGRKKGVEQVALASYTESVSDQMIYRSVRRVLESAATAMEVSKPDLAREIRSISMGPHRLRHTGITLAMAEGEDPRHVQATAGHRSLAVTTTVYDTKRQTDLMDMAERRDPAFLVAKPAA